MPTMPTLFGVFLGGCLGTGLRAGVGALLGQTAGGSWATTLTVNVLGALVVGLSVAWLDRWPAAPSWVRPTFVVGALGSFTTYSALAIDAGRLGRTSGTAFLVGYPALSLLLGLVAVRVGLWMGQPRRTTIDDPPC